MRDRQLHFVALGPSIGRRVFLRGAAAAGLALMADRTAFAIDRTGRAAELRIGVVWPAEDATLLGVRLGTDEAAHAARLLRSEFAVHEAVAADADTAAAAAWLVREVGVNVLVGGGAPAAADLLMATAAAGDALFVNIGVPVEALRQRCGARAFHVYASDAMRRDALAAAPPDTPSDASVLAWHPALTRYGAGQINERFERATGSPMTEPAWNGWLAIKILFEAAQRVGSTAAADLAAHLAAEHALFDGHKGVQLSFRPHTHQLRQPLYIVVDDGVHAEVPSRTRAGDLTHAQLLDTIGVVGGDTCTR